MANQDCPSEKRTKHGESISKSTFFAFIFEVGELTNINLFGRVLDNSEMEAVTLCQDHLDGDLVQKSFCETTKPTHCLQISWSAETYTVEGNVTRSADVLNYSKLCKPTKPWQRLFPVQLPALGAISVR